MLGKSMCIAMIMIVPALSACAGEVPADRVAVAGAQTKGAAESRVDARAARRPAAAQRDAARGKDPNCVRVEWQTRNVASFGGPMQMVRVPVCIKAKQGAGS